MELKPNKKLNDTQILLLLKNISEVLKTHTLDELNDFLTTAINEKSDTNLYENYIIELVCETYEISKTTLIHSKSNTKATMPREVAFCLLHLTINLSIRKIAKIFHFKSHNTVGKAIVKYKNLNPSIKCDREMISAIELLKEKVINKINNK
jgi:chromosomal replication initiation ATPase DnaA